jgi:hypothetical protein
MVQVQLSVDGSPSKVCTSSTKASLPTARLSHQLIPLSVSGLRVHCSAIADAVADMSRYPESQLFPLSLKYLRFYSALVGAGFPGSHREAMLLDDRQHPL